MFGHLVWWSRDRALDRSVASADVQGCQVSAADFERAVSDVRESSLELQTPEEAAAAAAAGPLPS